MTTWDEIENLPADAFVRTAAPTANPDGSTVERWEDLFVMVHQSALRLAPQRFLALCRAKRLMDNGLKDICKPVSVLEEVLGYQRKTLGLILDPTSTYGTRRKDNDEPLLSDYLRLRTTLDVTGGTPEAGYEDLEVDERKAHVWFSSTDLEEPERWRIDVEPIRFRFETDEKGNRRKVLATPDDAWVRVYYHWMYEHPDTTGGDTWVPKRYTALVKDRKTGQMVEQDVTAKAIRAAAVVAACATHEFKRGQAYGIAGMATKAGVSKSVMAQDLAYAEDAGLIYVANRRGRHKALRGVRVSSSDPRSPEGREKRSHGPTKDHNAEVMQARRLAREAEKAQAAADQAEAAEIDAATEDWLRGLPDEPPLAYAVGDEPPY